MQANKKKQTAVDDAEKGTAQTCAEPKKQTIASTLQRVYSEEGPLALYRGLGPDADEGTCGLMKFFFLLLSGGANAAITACDPTQGGALVGADAHDQGEDPDVHHAAYDDRQLGRPPPSDAKKIAPKLKFRGNGGEIASPCLLACVLPFLSRSGASTTQSRNCGNGPLAINQQVSHRFCDQRRGFPMFNTRPSVDRDKRPTSPRPSRRAQQLGTACAAWIWVARSRHAARAEERKRPA
ncbi:hypothetical protein ON010_g18809 [Phytophthora cinnamomi]|nr:hypothetical protein ON010_g18809 [Phytophthora cinnamomi]